MKTCDTCKEEKLEWEFSFSAKYSRYKDTCKACGRKKYLTQERYRLSRASPVCDKEFYRYRGRSNGDT